MGDFDGLMSGDGEEGKCPSSAAAADYRWMPSLSSAGDLPPWRP